MKPTKKFKGRHKFVCDVDGMVYYSEDKRIRWDGAVVHKDNWEPRHPQDLIRAIKEDTSVPNARPEKGDGSDQGDGYTYITLSHAERLANLGTPLPEYTLLIDDIYSLQIDDEHELILS